MGDLWGPADGDQVPAEAAWCPAAWERWARKTSEGETGSVWLSAHPN